MPETTHEDLRVLYEEQGRLRAQIERLDRELQEQKKNGASKDGGDGKEQKGGDKKEGDKKDQKDQQKPKEPVLKRARTWVRTHPVAFLLSIIGLVVIVIAGFFLWQYLESYESTDDAEVDGHTDPISPRVAGYVVGTYVENTYRVKKGEVLVDLDPRDSEVALARARANLAEAQSGVAAEAPNVPITETTQTTQVTTSGLDVASARAGLAAAEQTYQSSLADVQQAQATSANAAREAERYAQLIPKLEISREQYDMRVTEAHAQEALVASRRASADAARRAVDERQALLEQSVQRFEEAKNNQPRRLAIQHATYSTRQANALAAKAQLDQAVLNLSYCKIVAPVDGIVGDKRIQVGDQVQPGREMLAITETADMWVTANFKETQIRNMHPGQSATIQVDALSQTFNGYVEALPGGTGAIYSLLPPENATGNYVKVVQRLPVRIRFKPGQPHAERLAPGMSVEPKVWIK
jgi:membrane fusion protein, multidrug efflux system